jgi:hypothetical protein
MAANRLTLKERQDKGLHDDLLARCRALSCFCVRGHTTLPSAHQRETSTICIYAVEFMFLQRSTAFLA